MSDPITASFELGLLAIKTGVAVAQWWNTRQTSNTQSSPPDGGGSTPYRQTPENLLYVMATLGQWLFYLDVVDVAALSDARVATRLAFSAGDPEDDDLGTMFDGMNEFVQNAVACGMFFCAECWPMHIWNGFGCGIFNHLTWANPNNSNLFCLELDNSIAALKSQPHPSQPLKKSPSAISKTDPILDPGDKSSTRKLASFNKDIFQQLEKSGFPQPVAPYNHIRISYWWIPFATWNGTSMYENEYHKTDAISKYQCDPGRFLWAWTAGKKSRLAPGEAVLLIEDHIGALAQWLEGLRGINFKVLLDNQLNYSNIKYGRATRNMFKKLYGNEHGIRGEPAVIVQDPQLEAMKPVMEQLTATVKDLQISPTVTEVPPLSPTVSQLSSSPVLTPLSGRISFPTSPSSGRRPLPRPPPVNLRTVKAIHDFIPESDEELAFSQGDVIEILDDKSDDGWWKARLRGQTGLIPSTFVKDTITQDTKQGDETFSTLAATASPSAVPMQTTVDESPVPHQQDIRLDKRNSVVRKPVSMSSYSGSQLQSVISDPAITGLAKMEDPTVPITRSLEQQHFMPPPIYSLATAETAPQQQNQQDMMSGPGVDEQQTQTLRKDPITTTLWNLGDDLMAQPSLLHAMQGHSKTVEALAFSTTCDMLASGSSDKTIKLWDPVTGRSQLNLSAHEMGIEDLDFAANSTVLASASSDKTVRLWDARTAATIQTLYQSACTMSVGVSPDDSLLAAGLLNDTIKLWDRRSSSVLHVLKGHKSMVRSVEFSPDGRTLASGSNDKSIATWSSNSGQPLQKIKAHPGMMNYVMAVAFSPDGQLLASASLDGNVKVWNASTGAAVRTLVCGSGVNGVSFSPNGENIVASTSTGDVVVWNLSGRELQRFKAHEKSIRALSLSRDGKLMATGSEDKTVKVWRSRE